MQEYDQSRRMTSRLEARRATAFAGADGAYTWQRMVNTPFVDGAGNYPLPMNTSASTPADARHPEGASRRELNRRLHSRTPG